MTTRRDRRAESRACLRDGAAPLRVRVGSARLGWLVDLSGHGAGVMTATPLRPGSLVILGCPAAARSEMVEAVVVTCRVAALKRGHIRYRCGLAVTCAPGLRELASRHGYGFPDERLV